MGVPKVRAADNALSILPRTRMMVKGFKIDLWISLWDSETGWDSGRYNGMEKASRWQREGVIRRHKAARVGVCQNGK